GVADFVVLMVGSFFIKRSLIAPSRTGPPTRGLSLEPNVYPLPPSVRTGCSLPRLTDVIPQPDDRLIAVFVLEAEHAHAGGATEEHPSGGGGHAVPAGRDHPDDVAAGERQHVARHAVNPGNEAVGARGDLLRRVVVRATVAEQLPTRPVFQDVACKRP